jgi:uncharacterized protein
MNRCWVDVVAMAAPGRWRRRDHMNRCCAVWLLGRLRRHNEVVRIAVWVRPGSAHPGVGGEHDGALVVRVSERAVDGRATAAALAAVATALGVRRHAVTLIAGAASRRKIVDVSGADPAVLERLRSE